VASDVVLGVNEVVDVSSNGTVESDVSARDVTDVIGEQVELRNPLRPDNGLDLSLADLLGDHAFGKLFDDRELLLDDGHVDLLADDSLFENCLLVVLATEVVLAEEVVKVGKTVKIIPVIERDR